MQKRTLSWGFFSVISALGLAFEPSAQAETAVQHLRAYETARDCSTNPNGSGGCLYITSYRFKRHNGSLRPRSRVYGWKKTTDKSYRIYPHLQMEHLVASWNATLEQLNTTTLQAFGDQVRFMLTTAVFRSGKVLAWESDGGYASSFIQSEYANFFFEAGQRLKEEAGRQSDAGVRDFYKAWSDQFFIWASQFLNSFDVQSGFRTGGVRSPTQKCGPDAANMRSCFFFLGHNVPDSIEETAVLNKSAVAMRDLAKIYRFLSKGKITLPASAGNKTTIMNNIVYNLGASIMHLAFSRGNTKARPDVAPNLAQFMQDRGGFYSLYYSYNRKAHSGQNDSSILKHYQAHSLDAFASLFAILQSRNNLDNKWIRLGEGELLRYQIKKGVVEPIGKAGSRFALYQGFLTSMRPDLLVKIKSGTSDLGAGAISKDSCEFYRSQFPRVASQFSCDKL